MLGDTNVDYEDDKMFEAWRFEHLNVFIQVERILEFEEHPCKRLWDNSVDHGHNVRSYKTKPAHVRIPVSPAVRHKQSFIPRGAKLNLFWYGYKF